MTTKEWLNRGFCTFKRLQTKRAHLETLGNIVSRYESREIESFHSENSSENTMLTWSETKREVDRLEAELYTIDKETDKALSMLGNPNEYQILYLRYVGRLRWEEIETVTKFSRAHIFRLHSEGVDHVGEVAYSLIS